MKKIFFAAAALSLAAVAPASAQMMGMGGPMAGPMGGPGAQSCVSGGSFVPCPPPGGAMMGGPGMGPGMQPGMRGDMDPGMRPQRMTRREMREQRRMMREQQQGM